MSETVTQPEAAQSDRRPDSGGLRPAVRARRDLQFSVLSPRGERRFVVKDPLTLQYFHLRAEELFVLRCLDGRRSLDDIATAFARRFAPQILSLEQLQSFIARLHQDGLLVPVGHQPDRRIQRRRPGHLSGITAAFRNPLAIRLPGLDPDRMLVRITPFLKWCFSPWVVGGSIALALLAMTVLLTGRADWRLQLPTLSSLLESDNIFCLAVALAIVKCLHEAAHALTLKHFGGECHRAGVFLLLFTPTLYCDVSDAWMLRSRWQRMLVGAAGIWLELIIAATCAVLWSCSQPGLFHTLCLNIVLVCSVGTLVFNGNPLMRYDAYHILSDFLETPNLREQAGRMARHAWGCLLGGISPYHPEDLPERHRVLLAAYGILAPIYRVFVMAAIVLLLRSWLAPRGLSVISDLLAMIVAIGFLQEPVIRLTRFVRSCRGKGITLMARMAVGSGIAAALLAGCFLCPLPMRMATTAELEPATARNIYVEVPGRLTEVIEPDVRVAAGAQLAQLQNPVLDREVIRLQGLLRTQQSRIRALEQQSILSLGRHSSGDQSEHDENQLPAARERLREIEALLSRRQAELERLTITAPAAGTVIPAGLSRSIEHHEDALPIPTGSPQLAENAGCFLPTGALLCRVAETSELDAILLIGEAEVAHFPRGAGVRLKLSQAADVVLTGEVVEIEQQRIDLPRGQQPATTAGFNPQASRDAAEASFRVRVRLESPPVRLLPGMVSRAVVELPSQPLAITAWDWTRRTFQIRW